MAWDLLRGCKFQSQIFGVECRNFRDWFRTVRVEFRDCFQTFQVEFSRLFSDNPDRIFGTVFGQSRTEFRLGFNLKIDVFEFCGVFVCFATTVIR